MPEVNIIVKAKDEASSVMQGIGGSLKGLGTAFLGIGAVAGVALAGIGVGLAKLALDEAKMGPIEKAFGNLALSIGSTSDALLKKLRPATLGMLSNDQLIIAAQKLLISGLATTEDEVAKFAETATKLGLAVGKDATTSIEQFANMLLTGGTRALKEFGISTAEVEERVAALKEANADLTDEQAFQQAVMEVAAETIERTGDLSDTAAVKMAAMGARFEDVKDGIAGALQPALEALLTYGLEPLLSKVEEWVPKFTPIIEQVGFLAQEIMDPEGDWVAYLNNEVWEALDNAFGPEAADKIVDFVEDGIEGLQDFINDSLIPFVEQITGDDGIIAAFQEWWESDGFEGVLITLRAIGTTIGDLLTNISELKTAIDDLVDSPGFKQLVQWLTMGQEENFQKWYGGALEQLIPPIVARGEAQGLQEAYSQQGYVPAPGATWNINVYGNPGLRDEIRQIIAETERHT